MKRINFVHIILTILVIIVVGYDGVWLYGVLQANGQEIPVIGISYGFLGFITFLIGVFALWMRSEDKSARLFFTFCFWFALFMTPYRFSSYESALQFGWVDGLEHLIDHVGLILISLSFSHLFYRFPSAPLNASYTKWGTVCVRGLYVVDFLYIVFTILTIGHIMFSPQLLTSLPMRIVEWILVMAGFSLGFYFLGRNYALQKDVEIRHQLQWIFWGSAVGLGLSGIIWTLQLFSILTDPIWVLSHLVMITLPISFAFAIFKYRLMDIDLIIKRSLIYGILTSLIIVLFLVISASLAWAVVRFTGSKHELIPIITTVLLVYLFNPLKNEAQNLVNRTLYKNRMNCQNAILSLTEELHTAIELDSLKMMLMERLRGILGLSYIQLWLRSPYSTELVNEDGVYFTPPDRFLKWLIQINTPLRISELKKASFYGLSKDEIQTFDAKNITICVPLVTNSNIIGVLNLGTGDVGDTFISDELDVLNQMGRQAALALGYARLHAEVSLQMRLQQELEIAHKIQMDLLPAQSPNIVGLDVAGASLAARQMGGDFYDFITFDEYPHRLGVVIGDVAGKGIPGALIMATSRSIFRAQATEKITPAKAINATRPWVASDLQKGMFVAAGYALFDPPTNTLTYSLAGVPYPLLIRNGECRELSGTKFRFPFSRLKSREYDEQQFTMQPGDIYVLTTDGLEDAMSPDGEQYTIERLMHLLENLSNLPAQEILQKILIDVEDFIGDCDPFDDVTLVIVKMASSFQKSD